MAEQNSSKNKSLEKAITITENGVTINIHVSTQTKETSFPAGYNQWRQTIETKIKSPARDNQANKELIQSISQFFNMDEKDVQLVKGIKSPNKTVLLIGKKKTEIINKIMRAI